MKIVHDNSFELVSLPIGSSVKIKYKKETDIHGNSFYTERDSYDIQSEIQSHKDTCSLEILLNRLARASGDQIVSACSQTDTLSADLVGFPRDLTEAFIMHKELEKKIPNYNERIKFESIEEIIKSLIPNDSINHSETSTETTVETNEGDINNGTI